MRISRRAFLAAGFIACPALAGVRADAEDHDTDRRRQIAELEHRYGGRLGVAILDTATSKQISHRPDERFPLCSTFKFLAAALVLARVDRKEEDLARRITYTKSDLVAYSPTTEKHVGAEGLTVAQICEAAVTLSDNTAANLLLDSFGGPAGLTSYLRSLGDSITRLDRREPDLNEAHPGDPRDTTTPAAMLQLLQKIVLGSVLSGSSRDQLTAWLLANQTGGKRLRAGVPQGWRVADKTGTGRNNATNDVAVIWPPQRAPILVTAYYLESQASDEQRDAILSQVGRVATT